MIPPLYAGWIAGLRLPDQALASYVNLSFALKQSVYNACWQGPAQPGVLSFSLACSASTSAADRAPAPQHACLKRLL